MELFRTTWTQLKDLFGSMAPSQQAMFALVLFMMVGGFGYMIWNKTNPELSYVPLSVGKTFSVAEIIHAEEALQQASLTQYKREGQRLYVPRDEVEKYNSALIASGTMPQNWAEEWEKQYADLGPFANNKQMMDRKEIARAKLASQMISGMPGVDTANVVWDQQEMRRWPHEPKSTATVFIRPKHGHQFSPHEINGIRMSIAGMKADLTPQDVTVLDLSTGTAHRADDEKDPMSNAVVRRIQQLQDLYRQEVNRAVDYIDHVKVAVNVDIDKIRTAIRRKQEIQTKGSVALVNTESTRSRTFNQTPVKSEPGQNANGGLDLNQKPGLQRTEQVTDSDSTQVTAPTFEVTQEDIMGAMPQNVQVSVVIPDDYYRAIGVKSGELDTSLAAADQEKIIEKIRVKVNQAVKSRVAKIIPAGTRENPEDAVDVGSYVRLDDPNALLPSAPNFMENATWAINQWGSAALLLIFALWAMRMLNSSVTQAAKNTPPVPELHAFRSPHEKVEEEESDYPPVEMPETRSREQLQKIVRENPDMAAAILNRWMVKSK
jgi:flagellar M-ring protein FliF